MRLAALRALIPLRYWTRQAPVRDAVADTPAEAEPPTEAEPPASAESPPAVHSPLDAESPEESVDVRERRLAERLLEDEGLRGDLDDATWQPIQDWLLATAGHLARGTQGLTDAEADEHLHRARRALKDAAQVIQEALAVDADRSRAGPLLDELPTLLVPAVLPVGRAAALAAHLRRAGEQIEAEALEPADAAACLVAALAADGDVAEPDA
jgi:hypothetical protein